MIKSSKLFVAAIAALALSSQHVLGCTGIVLNSADGATVPARTMEFSFDIHSNIFAVPAGTEIETLALNPDKTGCLTSAPMGPNSGI